MTIVQGRATRLRWRLGRWGGIDHIAGLGRRPRGRVLTLALALLALQLGAACTANATTSGSRIGGARPRATYAGRVTGTSGPHPERISGDRVLRRAPADAAPWRRRPPWPYDAPGGRKRRCHRRSLLRRSLESTILESRTGHGIRKARR
ncbi:hypothetical protein ACIBU0_15655 [Streptomyces sp. NPDC049627]|uniref:hypothetical protein n=1 Tax=Streptomyces sp. NPDC049627 TaxID=3365595 RepID=UPI0037AF5A81